MARQWFATQNTVRLDLGDEEWIEIHEQLTYGEQEALTSSSFERMPIGAKAAESPEVTINWGQYNIKRMDTWIVDWSAKGPNGKPMPKNKASIAALLPEMAQVIDDALTKYVEALEESKNVVTAPGAA